MTFAHPILVWVAVGSIPVLAAFFTWSWRTRKRLITAFVPKRLQDSLTLGVSPRRAVFRAILLIVGLAALFLALARPRLGIGTIEVSQRSLDILIAIDTSRSMLAEDAGPEVSRLQRAKLAALDLARLARHDRVGLVAFAGSAFLQCPLTIDDEAFRQSVEALDSSIIPQGGTAIGPAIHTALDAFSDERENVRVLILFTDGEEHEPGALDAAKRAQAKGLRIYTLGVGTARGEIIRLVGTNGAAGYLKDAQGNVVKSSLNESLLRDIARITDGLYLPLQGPSVMSDLFHRALEPLPRADLEARSFQQFHERFQWPLGLAILLLLAEMLLPDRARTRGRPRAVSRAHPTLAQAAVVLFLATLSSTAWASPKTAQRRFEKEDYTGALAEYERLAKEHPTDPRYRYNAGVAAYRAGNYDAAQKHLQDALASTDLSLQERSFFTLGNTRFRMGEAAEELPSKQTAWEQSLQAFEAALKLNAKDTNAQHNLDYVRRRLEELKQQQQQQQQQQPSKDSDDSKDDSKDQDPPQDSPPDSKDRKDPKDSRESGDSEPRDGSSGDNAPPSDGSEDQEPNQPPPDSTDESPPSNDGASPGDPNQGQDSNREGKPDGTPQGKDQPPTGEAGDAEPVKPGEMSRQQALRLLDSAKGEERLVPLEKRKSRTRIVKDW